MEEDDKLLLGRSAPARKGAYGTEDAASPKAESGDQPEGGGSKRTRHVSSKDPQQPEGDKQTRDPAAKRLFPWWRKERKLQKTPSLDELDEEPDRERRDERESRRSCPDGLFGVKSYLHNFYESHHPATKDPTIYEEDEEEYQYLLNPPRRGRRCTSIWWKVFVWIGANFLIFGILGVLLGYLVPQKPIFVGPPINNKEVMDNGALAFNFNLDVCKLVGLILFCIGGLTLAVALLFPSFLHSYCDEDRRDGSFKVHVGDEKPPHSPLEMQIPTSSKITGVQPERKGHESIATKEGMLPFKD